MAQPLVLACMEADFDPHTGECAAPFYTYSATGWPTLSIEDAQAIGMAIALLLAVAFVCRRLRKFLETA